MFNTLYNGFLLLWIFAMSMLLYIIWWSSWSISGHIASNLNFSFSNGSDAGMLSNWNVVLLKIMLRDSIRDDNVDDDGWDDVSIVNGIWDVDEKGWPFGEDDNEENIDVNGRECWNDKRFDLEYRSS